MTLKLFKVIYEFFIKLVYEDEDVPMMMQFVYEERLLLESCDVDFTRSVEVTVTVKIWGFLDCDR